LFKGTVNVIVSDSLLKDKLAWFTTVLFKPLSIRMISMFIWAIIRIISMFIWAIIKMISMFIWAIIRMISMFIWAIIRMISMFIWAKKDDIHVYLSNNKDDIHVYLSNNKDDIHVYLSKNKDDIRGMMVSYLYAQLAVLYTYNCLPILIYYRLGQNLLIINKYAERSQYSWWPIQIGLAYIITLFTITSLDDIHVFL